MAITEKVAYLKGLADGVGLSTDTKEGKLISAIIDTLSDLADEVEKLEENALDLGDEIDVLSDDLSDIEKLLFDDDDGDDDDDCGCCDDDDCSCGCCGDDDDDFSSYEVACPACGIEITLTEEDLANGSIDCPNCDERLEFEFDNQENDTEEEK